MLNQVLPVAVSLPLFIGAQDTHRAAIPGFDNIIRSDNRRAVAAQPGVGQLSRSQVARYLAHLDLAGHTGAVARLQLSGEFGVNGAVQIVGDNQASGIDHLKAGFDLQTFTGHDKRCPA